MTHRRPTLIVHTVYFPIVAGAPDTERPDDPEREAARRLGLDLYDLLCRPREDRLGSGAGVPVRVATRYDHVDTQEAEEVVLIPVLGAPSHRREDVRAHAITSIRDWVQALGPRHVLPLLTSESWRGSEPALAVKLLLNELYSKGDGRRAALDEIVLGIARVLHGDDALGQQLFISHAKQDLDTTDRAAEKIRDHVLLDRTGQAFFDSVSLLAGENLDEQLDRHSREGVFLMVRGDRYSSRSYCEREYLNAKRARLPILTLEVLRNGERRSLAYAGNGPTVVWQDGDPDAAAKVVRRAMVEGVGHALFRREAARVLDAADLAGTGVETLSRPPELLDIAALRGSHPGRLVILHPDPELSVHEQGVLQEAHPRLRTITPTTVYRGALGRVIRGPLDGWQIALSLSSSPDVDGPDGATSDHVDDAIAYLARALVGAGAAIAYGGDFRSDGFTETLTRLVRAYNETARTPADFLHSYLAAPIDVEEGERLTFTAHSLGRFGDLENHALLEPPTGGWPPPARAALYFSDMRRVMEREIHARIVLGGQAVPKDPDRDRCGYGGRYPGVVEEAWRSLERGTPLYVVGGFGGAAGLVADLLESDRIPERLRDETFLAEQHYAALAAAIAADPDAQRLGLPAGMGAMAAAIRDLARPHLDDDDASRRWNGLTVAQNRQLFRTRDPLTIVSLVFEGLLSVVARQSAGDLHIELTRGSVTDVQGPEVLVLPAFSDVPPGGAVAAVDRVTEGAASRARGQPGRPLRLESGAVDADYLYVADLGPMNRALEDVEGHVRHACETTMAMARRHGFTRIGLVTFLGNVAESVAAVAAAMVDGLRAAGGAVEIVWVEQDADRFETLKKTLETLAHVAVSTRELRATDEPAPLPGTSKTIVGVIQRDEALLDVSLLVPHGNGIVPIHRAYIDAGQRQRFIDGDRKGAPGKAALVEYGRELSQLLFGDAAQAVLEACRDCSFVVVHDPSSADLPFETLSMADASGAAITPATAGGVVRRLQVAGAASDSGLTRPPHVGELKVLLVGNPTQDLDGARREAATVRKVLTAAGASVVTLLEADATVDAVLRNLSNDCDVFHYCGHAFFDGPGEHESGLKCADGDLTLEHLRSLNALPRVAFVNACEAGRVRAAPAVAAAAPAQAFAEFFLRAGLDAYVGTFWQVTDRGAETFAGVVYQQLAGGTELGDAVVLGRQALAAIENPDWANYLLYGDGSFRLVRPVR